MILITAALLLAIQLATGVLECPDGSAQIGSINADIAGCGLESCSNRYTIPSIEDCQTKCLGNLDCLSFSWAPLGGDRNHLNYKVCTIYDTATATGTWSPEQILCAALECPSGSTQVGNINADIGGCGLESCDDRYTIPSIEECYNKCNSNPNCLSFTWAPLGGDRNHANYKVCTLYDSTTPTGTWSPRQIMCEITTAANAGVNDEISTNSNPTSKNDTSKCTVFGLECMVYVYIGISMVLFIMLVCCGYYLKRRNNKLRKEIKFDKIPSDEVTQGTSSISA